MAHRWAAVQSGEARGLPATGLRGLLWVASLLYRSGRWLHRGLYRSGLKRRHRLSVPVISIGNLSAGGVGKTPLVAWLGQQLLARGRRPAVLARGYGRRPGEALNEEGEWLRSAVPDMPVLQDPQRGRAAEEFLRSADCDVFLLDDGFQHEALHRDLELVLLDATRPLGFGYLLPRGTLRDSPARLTDADLVLLTRCELLSGEQLDEVESTLKPWLNHVPGRIAMPVDQIQVGDQLQPSSCLQDRDVLLACAVGHPQSVEQTIQQLGGKVVERRWFSDHHDYQSADVVWMLEQASQQQAVVVTTAKDWIKLRRLWPDDQDPPHVLQQRLTIQQGEDVFWQAVEAVLPSSTITPPAET